MPKLIEFEEPFPQNFVRLRLPPKSKEAKLESLGAISVDDLSASEAEEYAELLKNNFIAYWKSRQPNA
jgi:hypothetical protein